ncbi:hypothetical protein ACET3Z_010467 [Daucus carota]
MDNQGVLVPSKFKITLQNISISRTSHRFISPLSLYKSVGASPSSKPAKSGGGKQKKTLNGVRVFQASVPSLILIARRPVHLLQRGQWLMNIIKSSAASHNIK